MPVDTITWHNGKVRMIDQTLLPNKLVYIETDSYEEIACTIERLGIRGAPAIGIAAAYGVAVGAQGMHVDTVAELAHNLDAIVNRLARTRPTAVNLFWALDRMRHIVAAGETNTEALKDKLLQEAHNVLVEDTKICRGIGEHGALLLKEGTTVLTHCNAGGLATGTYGTALAPVYIASEEGRTITVFADETRPLLQGGRLTAWELDRAGIEVTVICDNMAGVVMREGKIDLVIVGADRIAANGDTANKIGTYSVAVLAQKHGIPFYVAAPTSTFDMTLPEGSAIPIEERDGQEIRAYRNEQITPQGVAVYNPAFDVTPAELIAGIITEHGIIKKPNTDNVARMLGII